MTILGKCDRCGAEVLDSDEGLCFNTTEGEVYMCEPCIEIVREEFIDEIRRTDIQ
tara:strand:+ start:2908 stop:3072 length:165 start_codon:yes stop_codon:yes gene_type:complete